MTIDVIQNVPTDDAPVDPNDINLIKEVFSDKKSNVGVYVKKYAIFLILFTIISLPQFDNLVFKISPKIEKFKIIYIIIKGILLLSIYHIINNMIK